VSGIYEDCSWVVNRHQLGAPDGENWYNGGVRMRKYFRALMPEVAVMGERNNEVTARGQKFALSLIQWENHAHSINAYVFGRFLRMWNINQAPRGFDADDIRGWMTKWPAGYEEHPIQERLMLRKRGVVFASEQLTSHWPDTWAPDVMHYFRDKTGGEYRFVRRNGTRFVKLTPDGEELIYWRLHGVSDAAVGQAGVEGWLGYDGDRIPGLNPEAVYITIDDVQRPPVTISSVPEGWFIRRSLIRDGFWLDTFDRLNGKKPAAASADVPVTVRVCSTGPEVSFAGSSSVKKHGKNEFEVVVRQPGGLVAYWTDPELFEYGTLLSEFSAVNTVSRRDTGIISQTGRPLRKGMPVFSQEDGSVQANEEGNIAWLVRIPEFGVELDGQPFLVFKYGTDHAYGDGANYIVRVNGEQRWKRYRPQIVETKKPDGEREAPPLKTGVANLKKYAGEVVVLELAVDGNRTDVSETIRWHHPMLKSSAPFSAETDDDQGGPELSAPDTLMGN